MKYHVEKSTLINAPVMTVREFLEAVYSFPIPEKAAIGEFTFWIDGQPVTGEVF